MKKISIFILLFLTLLTSCNNEEHTHQYVGEKVESTCIEQGYTTYICECGDSYVADYVDAKGHTEVIDARVEPTAITTGLTEGSHCEICGDILVAQEEVTALGHQHKTVFTWSKDHTSCVVTITCERSCGLYESVECVVTHSQSNLTKTTHPAVAEFDGARFTDVLTCDNFLFVFKDWDGEGNSLKQAALARSRKIIDEALQMVTDDEVAAALQYNMCNFKTVAKKYPDTEYGRLVKGACDNLKDYHAETYYSNE
jgi:hypothetical protein